MDKSAMHAVYGHCHLRFDNASAERVSRRIGDDIEAEHYDGARLLVAYRGERVLDVSMGYADREACKDMEADSVFCIMSITKVITAIAVMQRIEAGQLSMLTPVAEIIPEFAQFGKGLVTLGQILTHTAGMGMATAPVPVEKLGDLRTCVAAICALPLEMPPGEQVSYSATMGYTILGEIVRRLDRGRREYREILAEDVFQPLRMTDTAMGLPDRLMERRVPVVVRDVKAPELNPAFLARRDATTDEATELPSGGVFSTASDVLRLAEALRLNGALNGERVLAPATVQFMRQNQTGDKPNSMMNSSRTLHGLRPFPAFLGVGLFLRGIGVFPSHMPIFASSETFGGWGLGSTAFWVDPVREVSFVMLTSGLMERIGSLLRFQRIGDMVLSSFVYDQ